MRTYKLMKLQMKVAYEAWTRRIEKETLLHLAILKTVQEKLKDATEALKQVANSVKFNA